MEDKKTEDKKRKTRLKRLSEKVNPYKNALTKISSQTSDFVGAFFDPTWTSGTEYSIITVYTLKYVRLSDYYYFAKFFGQGSRIPALHCPNQPLMAVKMMAFGQ